MIFRKGKRVEAGISIVNGVGWKCIIEEKLFVSVNFPSFNILLQANPI